MIELERREKESEEKKQFYSFIVIWSQFLVLPMGNVRNLHYFHDIISNFIVFERNMYLYAVTVLLEFDGISLNL